MILFILASLVVPIGFSSVNLSSGVEIIQTDNDVVIEVEDEVSVPYLENFVNATDFGGVNYSVSHTVESNLTVDMRQFNPQAGEGETVTDYTIDASSGDEVDFDYNNLTERRFYELYIDGQRFPRENVKDEGSFSYEYPYPDSEPKDFELRAAERENIDHTSFFFGGGFEPNESVTISGSGEYTISEDDVVGGTIELFDSTGFWDSGVTDDSGEYSIETEIPKEAGTHNVELNLSRFGIYDTETTEITVESLFLEDAEFEIANDQGSVDINEEGAINISVKVYENLDREIDEVSYRIFDSEGDEVIIPIEKLEERLLTPKSNPSETTVWEGSTLRLSEVPGLDPGTHVIELSAFSGDFDEKTSPEFEVDVKNLDMNLETDKRSYSNFNDDKVNVTGRVVKQPEGEIQPNIDVDLEVLNATSGEVDESFTVQTNDTGYFYQDFAVDSEAAVRQVRATSEDEFGISGVETVDYTVTALSIDSVLFDDSEVNHSFNMTASVSDSRGINEDQSCELEVSDNESNTEIFNMSINTSVGTEEDADCFQNNISYLDNSEWDPIENLEIDITVGNESDFTTRTEMHQLPNTPPEVIEYNIEQVEKAYEYTVEAKAFDPNKGEDEIEACNIYYYNENGDSFVEEGNLDVEFGEEDEAFCSFNINPSLEGVEGFGEDITTQVEFVDQQGATDMSDNKTGTLEASMEFNSEIRDLTGDGKETTLVFKDPDSGDIINTLSDDEGDIHGFIPKGTHNVVIEIFGHEIQLNNASIEEDVSTEFVFEPNVGNRFDDNISNEWVRETGFFYADDVDLDTIDYDDVTVTFNYNPEREQYVTPWYCDSWNDDLDFRECRETGFNPSPLDYEPQTDYRMDVQNNRVSFDSDEFHGAYVMAYNNGFREAYFWRQEVTVEGAEQPLEDYQVKFTLDTQEQIVEDRMDEDCSSVRIYDTHQEDQLDYWLDPNTCNTDQTEVWVEMSRIPSLANKTIFVYFNEDKAEKVSSGEDTFIEFDNFEDPIESDYETSGRVDFTENTLRLSSRNEEVSRAVFDSNITPPYRTHSTVDLDTTGSEGNVSTHIIGTDKVFYSFDNDSFGETYSGSNVSIESGGSFSMNQSITSAFQKIRFGTAEDSVQLEGDIPMDPSYPFGASFVHESGDLKDMEISRWFTTNYAESTPKVVDTDVDREWSLTFNGSEGDTGVQFNRSLDIELVGTGFGSDVRIKRDGGVVAEGDSVESVAYRENNLDENRSYEIRGEIDRYDEVIINDIIVGNDTEAPDVEIDLQNRTGTNEMKYEFRVRDNYIGAADCRLEIENELKDTTRINLPASDTFYEGELSTSTAPHGKNTAVVYCTDQSGNTGNESINYEENFEGPDIVIESPSTGEEIWSVRPVLEFSLEDLFAEDMYYEIYYEYDSELEGQSRVERWVNGTLSNDTTESVLMPKSTQFGEDTEVIIRAEDNQYSNSTVRRFDLFEPDVDLISPQPGDNERRTFFNPDWEGVDWTSNQSVYDRLPRGLGDSTDSSDNWREIMPSYRITTTDSEMTFEYNYTNQAMDQAICRVVVDEEVLNATETVPGQVTQIDVDLDPGVNQVAQVQCEVQTGEFSSLGHNRHIDFHNQSPDIRDIRFSEGNNTEYRDDVNHEVMALTTDNFETPSFNTSTVRGRTVTDSNPFLSINGTKNAVIMRNNFSTDGSVEELRNQTVFMENQTYIYDCTSRRLRSCAIAITGTEPTERAVRDLGPISPGTYQFKYWVRDDAGNTFESDDFIYRVEEADPALNIFTDNFRAADNTIVRDTSPEVRCSTITDQVTTELTRDGVPIDSSDSGEVLEDNTVLDTGIYEYECDTSGNENYTADQSQRTIEVVEFMEDEVNISINGSQSNRSFTFGEEPMIEASSRSGNEELFFQGESINNPVNVSPEVGQHEVFAESPGSYRFNYSNTTITLNITNNVTFTSNFSINKIESSSVSRDVFERSIWATPFQGMEAIRGDRPEIKCESGASESDTKIKRDGDIVKQGQGTINHVVNTSEIDEGVFHYTCEKDTDDPLVDGSSEFWLSVEVSPAPDMIPGVDSADKDGSEELVQDGFNFNDSVLSPPKLGGESTLAPSEEFGTGPRGNRVFVRNLVRGSRVSVTCDTVQNVPSNLLFEGADVDSTHQQTFDEVGSYSYECVTQQTEDFRAIEPEIEYDVMNLTSTQLTANEQQQDIEIEQKENIDLLGSSNVSDVPVELITNRTNRTGGTDPFWREEDGEAEITTDFMIPGVHNITAFQRETDEHFSSQDSLLVDVEDVTAPRITPRWPQDGDITNPYGSFDVTFNADITNPSGSFDVTFNATDYSEYTCTIRINDTVEAEVSANGLNEGDAISGLSDDIHEVEDINRNSGVYEFRPTCEDEHGNSRTENIQFRLDMLYPNATILEEDFVQTGRPDPTITVRTEDISREHEVEIIRDADINPNDDSDDDAELENGTVIAEETIPEGEETDIRIDPQAPSEFDISFRIIDELGQKSIIHDTSDSGIDRSHIINDSTRLNISTNIAIMNPRSTDRREFVNTKEPELSFRYYSEEPLLDCTVYLNDNQVEEFSSIPEDTIYNYTAGPLEEGQHEWSVSCAGEEESFENNAEFWVDITPPEINSQFVSEPSGHAFTGEPLTWAIYADDNFEVENATFEAASDFVSREMFCNEEGVCETQELLEPGTHNYNFTVCDAAGNCESTGTTEYEVLDESSSMNLRLNGEQDNITITEDPIVNISGEFVSPKEGTAYFYINETLSGRCERGSGCSVEENFIRPNGSYRIDAQFFSFTDSTSHTETYWINAQVPESEWRGFLVKNLPEGKFASIRRNPGFNLLEGEGVRPGDLDIGSVDVVERDVLLGGGLGQDLAAQVAVAFSNDLDGSNISFGTDRDSLKSYLHLETDYPEIVRKDLLVPRVRNTGEVRVCPGARSLEEVSLDCESGFNITSGETVGSVSMEEVEIEGQRYYEVQDVRGTGGQEITEEQSTTNQPSDAVVEEIATFNQYVGIDIDDSLEVLSGRISAANVSSVQSTDDWAGIYGNASGDISLGDETGDVLFRWPAEPDLIFAANDTVSWSEIRQADLTAVDEYFGIQDQSDSAVNTFEEERNYEFNGIELSDTPSVRTYNASMEQEWVTSILSDGETPVFLGEARSDNQTSFDGKISDYQMMVPAREREGTTYSMYMEIR